MAGPLETVGEAAHAATYELVRAILRPVLERRVSIRCEGAGHVPGSGPALLVSNHRSVIDPFVIGAVLHRHVHFVAASWMGAVPGLREILRAMGILILPPAGRSSALVDGGGRHLAAGALLGIFPEGALPTMGPPTPEGVGPFRRGVARLILDCGIPELPVVPTGLVPGDEQVAIRLPGAVLRRLDQSDPLYLREYLDLMAYDAVMVRFGPALAFVGPCAGASPWRRQAEDAICDRLRSAVVSLVAG